jgi:hypothetical protein
MTSGPASSRPIATRRCLFAIAIALFAVTIAAADTTAGEPVKATVCELRNDPSRFNHKQVEVTGFVTHASHNFTVFDPTCPAWPAIWLEYGGKLNSGTVNCCKTMNDRQRPRDFDVEGIDLPLQLDQQFQDFDRAIQPPFRSGQYGAIEHATLLGTFFAGQRMEDRSWGGFGYLGCCSMLVIQQVKAADTQPHPDLDYGESNDHLKFSQPGCTLRMLLPEEQDAALIEAQKAADSGTRDWAIGDPARVASDALSHLAHVSSRALAALKLTRDAPARKTYESNASGSGETWTVVVARPYWLSFYAHDPQHVAWVPMVAFESACTGEEP